MRRLALRSSLVLLALGALTLVGLVLARRPTWKAMARSDRLLREAQARSGKGDRQAAREKLEEALRVYPGNARAHRELGLFLFLERKTQEAVVELRRAAEASPRDPGAAWELAHAYLGDGQPTEAEPWFRRVTRLQPSNGAAYAMLANCQLQRGAKEEALRSAERGVRISPRIPTTHVTLGLVRWETGDAAGARACFEKALSLDPGSKIARAELKRLGARERP